MEKNPIKEILATRKVEVVNTEPEKKIPEDEAQPEDGTVEVPAGKFPDLKEGSTLNLKVIGIEDGKLILATDREDDETKMSKEIIAEIKSKKKGKRQLSR